MELHEKLRHTREMRKVTVKDLSEHLSISESLLRQMEKDNRTIPPAILRSIAVYLNVPIEYYMSTDDLSLEEFLVKHKFMSGKYEEYNGYMHVIDKAKAQDIPAEELEAFLEFIRKLKKRSS